MHIASFFLFFVTEQSRGFFLVQTGVRGKAEQRSRAAVRRIQAGAGSGPRERGDTAKRDICWPATAPCRPPWPSCLGEGRKPAFSHCHCVPDRFVNQLGSSSASHAGCRSSLTGEEEEGEEEEELQGEGQGQPRWASRAPAPFTPESCPRPACVPENQRQGGRNPPAAGAPGTQGLEKGEGRAQDSCLGLCPSPTPAFHLPVPGPWTDPWPAGAACPRASAAGSALTTIAGRASWSKYFLKCPEQPLSLRLRNNHSSCQLPCSHRGLGRARACGCGSHSRGTGPSCSKPQGSRAGLGTCGCLFPWKPEENPWILTFLSPSCKPTASSLIFVLLSSFFRLCKQRGRRGKKEPKGKYKFWNQTIHSIIHSATSSEACCVPRTMGYEKKSELVSTHLRIYLLTS